MSNRCKLKGCKSELTNPDDLYCSIHKYKRGDDNVFSERDVGR